MQQRSRVSAATHLDLHQAVRDGRFREDAGIDWALLLLFIGLFVFFAAVESLAKMLAQSPWLGGHASVPVLAVFAAVLSNIISNVPAVLALKPFLGPLVDPQKTWLTVAMASTLAGKLHDRRIGRESDCRAARPCARRPGWLLRVLQDRLVVDRVHARDRYRMARLEVRGTPIRKFLIAVAAHWHARCRR
jgi:hypothetical protein